MKYAVVTLLVIWAAQATANQQLRGLASEVAQQYNLDPELFSAIVEQESSWNVSAYNAATADYGLTQINEYNVKALNLDRERLLTDPRYNLEAGAKILSYFQKRYAHKERLWFARYNCGTRALPLVNQPKCMKYAELINNRRPLTVAMEER
jgi:soluble lytic murein transglycosylase-like protein